MVASVYNPRNLETETRKSIALGQPWLHNIVLTRTITKMQHTETNHEKVLKVIFGQI